MHSSKMINIPGFVPIIFTENKNPLENKSELFVDWKLFDIDSKSLPYNDVPALQKESLEESGLQRLDSCNIFLRSDHIKPEEIILERKGFHPHPTINPKGFGDLPPEYILNVESHRVNSERTGFVSCTDSMQFIKNYNRFTASGNYVYMLKAKGAVNPGNSWCSREREYSVPGGVDATDIIAFRQLSTTSGYDGFNGSILYIREDFFKNYPKILFKMVEVYEEPGEEVSIDNPHFFKMLEAMTPIKNSLADNKASENDRKDDLIADVKASKSSNCLNNNLLFQKPRPPMRRQLHPVDDQPTFKNFLVKGIS
jgi:hypothetical protein